jgi:hypothetical protein
VLEETPNNAGDRMIFVYAEKGSAMWELLEALKRSREAKLKNPNVKTAAIQLNYSFPPKPKPNVRFVQPVLKAKP